MKIFKMVFSTFLLIGLLGNYCFLVKVDMMKKNFLLMAQNTYAKHNMLRVNIEIKGNGYKMKRIMILSGVVLSEKDKEKAEQIALSINGIVKVENNLKIKNINKDLSFKIFKLKNRKENHI